MKNKWVIVILVISLIDAIGVTAMWFWMKLTDINIGWLPFVSTIFGYKVGELVHKINNP